MTTTHPTTGSLPGQQLKDAHPPELLADWLDDSRQRTLQLVADLDDRQLIGPRLDTVNPLLWELGHLAWFAERWVLRRHGEASLRSDADTLYNSSAVPHDTRWNLPLPTRRDTLAYLDDVHRHVLGALDQETLGLADTYFLLLAIFHEDMHGEAFAITRQTLGYPAPRLSMAANRRVHDNADDHVGDVSIPGGRFLLGALPAEPFVFDNEKWAHPVDVPAFAISRTCVTQAEFAAFADDGYARKEWWSDDGWRWRESAAATHPVYWRRDGHAWIRREFDRWRPLDPDLPVLNVCWYEAEAYCRWARRRLPTEAEWEVAAARCPSSAQKRRFPWGDDLPSPQLANLDGYLGGCASIGACPDGDSAWGCRQLLGNVWEWTAGDFVPYPGFAVDPYEDYSRPWFGTHKVLRGGCWLTRSRMLRNTYRNFYKPDRRDVWAGFRTCALP